LAVTLAALLQVLAFVSVSGAGEKRYTLLVSVSTCSYNCQFL
jgi:amino acid permease